MKVDCSIAQLRLYLLFDSLVQLYFFIPQTIHLTQAFRVKKDNVLLCTNDQPKDKVRIEIMTFKKANSFFTDVT